MAFKDTNLDLSKEWKAWGEGHREVIYLKSFKVKGTRPQMPNSIFIKHLLFDVKLQCSSI